MIFNLNELFSTQHTHLRGLCLSVADASNLVIRFGFTTKCLNLFEYINTSDLRMKLLCVCIVTKRTCLGSHAQMFWICIWCVPSKRGTRVALDTSADFIN